MEVLGVLLVLSAGILGAGLVRIFWWTGRGRSSRSRRQRDELQLANLQVDGEFRRARLAMNDAAGQSWRNLAG